MHNYIITCRTSNGDLKERHVAAKNHLAAAELIAAEGFTVLSIDRDDEAPKARSRKRLKGLFASIAIGVFIAVACVAVAYLRYGRHM